MKYLFGLCIGLGFSILSYADTKFTPPPLTLEPLATFKVDLNAPVWELGKTSDLGQRRIIPITGGTFAGPLIKGRILNNGADWQTVDSNGLAHIDTRYLLETEDGALIYLQTKGYRYGSPAILKQLSLGHDVDPTQYYFKLTMQFETSAPQYAWLNKTIAVGSAMRLGKAVIYDAFTIK
ncbi:MULTISPECIES: DUF3237 domain-containing protein [unclassified Acinetobacter]|uniref:DUF3237 domain-containing protein n=1 Tax=unclassified Acinetobacter TaxID=196816 RepID=UPI0029351292|nr:MULTISPECIES: DUF3237 domain-containing protein [unclassified Acinetobacter]WOE32930.1 DUF3237 domain-containing protein [Acinetobacter sp. SAAs470]WOE38407.1 DUF3237 domain-containing protein [Acinetobacter sp. SAAs474]